VAGLNGVVTSEDVHRWEGMARVIASEYWMPGGEYEDLLQEARFGIFKALRDYQPERAGNAKAAFVALCVRRQVMSAVKCANAGKHSTLNESVRIIRDPDEGGHIDAVDVLPASDTPPRVLDRREQLHDMGVRMRERLSLVECQCLLGLLNAESYEEMSETYGLDLKTIDNAIQRARRKLEAATGPECRGERRGYSCPGCGGPTRKRPGRGRPPKCVVCRARETRGAIR
jgi:RNA polymerase sporulation-specific sigma factor